MKDTDLHDHLVLRYIIYLFIKFKTDVISEDILIKNCTAKLSRGQNCFYFADIVLYNYPKNLFHIETYRNVKVNFGYTVVIR